jgi:hypothetical protein
MSLASTGPASQFPAMLPPASEVQRSYLLQLVRHPILLCRTSQRTSSRSTHGVCLRGVALGKGGTVSLYADGKKVGEGKVGATAAMIFSADDGCDVGVDTGSPVSPDHESRGNEFSGQVKGVQLAIAEGAERESRSPRLAGGSCPHRYDAAVR